MLSFVPTGKKSKPNGATGGALQLTLTLYALSTLSLCVLFFHMLRLGHKDNPNWIIGAD